MQARFTCFVLLLALAAAPAFAQGEPEVPEPGSQLLHQGRVTDVDAAERAFTVETRTGPETFTLAEGGRVLGEGAEKGFDALAVGQQVTVEAIQDETDRWLARSVQIVNPNAASDRGGR
jgi:hypothetical protein